MASPVEGLRRILALEQEKKFADSAVVGGLDSYVLHYLQDNGITTDHELSRVMQALPPGGYRALHRIQRKRVVAELARIAADWMPTAASVQRPPFEIAQKRAAVGPKVRARSAVVPPPSKTVAGTLRSPLRILGVRKGDEERFRRMRTPVETVHDLLYYFPRDYHDYSEARKISELVFGEEQTVIGTVRASGQKAIGRQRRKATEVIINDSSGSLRVMWWNQ